MKQLKHEKGGNVTHDVTPTHTFKNGRVKKTKEQKKRQRLTYGRSERRKELNRLYKRSTKGRRTAAIYAAYRRALKLNATPKWADLEKIKEIYLNCPAGYHVDHIVPLKGKNICGLHIETNLQYLPASENLKKSNKF